MLREGTWRHVFVRLLSEGTLHMNGSAWLAHISITSYNELDFVIFARRLHMVSHGPEHMTAMWPGINWYPLSCLHQHAAAKCRFQDLVADLCMEILKNLPVAPSNWRWPYATACRLLPGTPEPESALMFSTLKQLKIPSPQLCIQKLAYSCHPRPFRHLGQPLL